MTCADRQTTSAIFRDLQNGYGVEDIEVRKTATKDQAQHLVNLMRQHDMLEKFYRKSKAKWRKQCKSR